MLALIALLLTTPAHADGVNIECTAFRWENNTGAYKEEKLTVGKNSDNFFSARAKFADVYYSIQGMTNRNRYSLTIYLDAPAPNGTGIFSDGTFDGDGYMRSSHTQDSIVYKLVCKKS